MLKTLHLVNTSITVSTKIIKVDFMAEQVYWIVLDCTGVPNKVATEGTAQ